MQRIRSRLFFFLKGLLGVSAIVAASIGIASLPSASGTASAPTMGPIPTSAISSNGTTDWSQVPDYVSVTSDNQIVGYVPKSDLMPTPAGQAIPNQTPSNSDQPPPLSERPQVAVVTVYGSNLSTVVGHMYPGKGFVPEGTDPSSVPSLPQPPISQTAPTG